MLNSPVLSQRKLRQLLAMPRVRRRAARDRPATAAPAKACEAALQRICAEAEAAVRAGVVLLLLSRPLSRSRTLMRARAARHRRGAPAPGPRRPALRLQPRRRNRHRARPHHFACLIGFGATAVYPYLAYQTLHDLGRARRDPEGKRGESGADRPQLPARHQEGPAEDHLEDGHQHHRQLSRRAAVRDHRPGRRRGRAVLRRHARRDRRRRLRRRSQAERAQLAGARLERRRAARDRRPAQVRARRRVPPVQPRRGRQRCSARCAPAMRSDWQRLRRRA